MYDLVIYLRKGLGDKSRDHTDVQSLNLIASAVSCSEVDMLLMKGQDRVNIIVKNMREVQFTAV